MNKKGWVLRNPHAGAGLLIVEGRQYGSGSTKPGVWMFLRGWAWGWMSPSIRSDRSTSLPQSQATT